MRRRAELKGLTAYRLFHGDAEGIPGLSVDRFADVAVIHADSPSLVDGVREELSEFETAYVKVHPRSASALTDERRRELAPDEPLWGRRVDEVAVEELGARYLARPAAGLSVGLFLDMREVRQWLRGAVADRSVLNLFAYTCSLGVCASLGGAARVVNLDTSRSYLEWGRANYQLNGCTDDAQDFIYGDAFDWLRRFARREQRFDVVIVDPPSFSSTPFSVTRDYPRLVAAVAVVLAQGGTLLAATNHAATTDGRFDAWLREGLDAAGRRGNVLRRWHEPQIDFPVPPGGRPYLKVRAITLD